MEQQKDAVCLCISGVRSAVTCENVITWRGLETENKEQFKYKKALSLREIGRLSLLHLLRLKNFITIKTLDKGWGREWVLLALLHIRLPSLMNWKAPKMISESQFLSWMHLLKKRLRRMRTAEDRTYKWGKQWTEEMKLSVVLIFLNTKKFYVRILTIPIAVYVFYFMKPHY